MQRIKTFDATGIAPNGRLYPGDLNAIQDAAAALNDFTQTIRLGGLAVGESNLQFIRYGALIARLTGALLLDGQLILGNKTSAQRDTIAAGGAPKGATIFNTDTGTLQVNVGTDNARSWQNVGDIGATLIDAKGDLFVGTGNDAVGRQGVGANGTVLTADSAQPRGVKWVPPTLTSLENRLSADVTMTLSNTFYDAASVSLPAGVWRLHGRTLAEGPGSNDIFVAKLWDGTTIADATTASRDVNQLINMATVIVASTTTWKVSVAAAPSNAHLRAAPPYSGAGVLPAKGCALLAMQIG